MTSKGFLFRSPIFQTLYFVLLSTLYFVLLSTLYFVLLSTLTVIGVHCFPQKIIEVEDPWLDSITSTPAPSSVSNLAFETSSQVAPSSASTPEKESLVIIFLKRNPTPRPLSSRTLTPLSASPSGQSPPSSGQSTSSSGQSPPSSGQSTSSSGQSTPSSGQSAAPPPYGTFGRVVTPSKPKKSVTKKKFLGPTTPPPTSEVTTTMSQSSDQGREREETESRNGKSIFDTSSFLPPFLLSPFFDRMKAFIISGIATLVGFLLPCLICCGLCCKRCKGGAVSPEDDEEEDDGR